MGGGRAKGSKIVLQGPCVTIVDKTKRSLLPSFYRQERVVRAPEVQPAPRLLLIKPQPEVIRAIMVEGSPMFHRLMCLWPICWRAAHVYRANNKGTHRRRRRECLACSGPGGGSGGTGLRAGLDSSGQPQPLRRNPRQSGPSCARVVHIWCMDRWQWTAAAPAAQELAMRPWNENRKPQ